MFMLLRPEMFANLPRRMCKIYCRALLDGKNHLTGPDLGAKVEVTALIDCCNRCVSKIKMKTFLGGFVMINVE